MTHQPNRWTTASRPRQTPEIRLNRRRVLAALPALLASLILPACSAAASARVTIGAGAAGMTVVQAMVKADAYWLAHAVSPTGATWQNSAFHVGNLAYVATPGATRKTATQSWAQKNGYTVAHSTGSAAPDDLAAGDAYLRLGQPASIRARVGGEVASGNDTLWSYVDALNMAMPSYARLGVLDNSAADLTAMQARFNYTENTLGLFDHASGLWWRDASFRGTRTFWSRGNGWALMALAKVLQVLPSTDSRYAGYLQVFKQMAAALVPLQLSDGLWGADLRNPSAYGDEESGTAFFTYAMAWGINAGILAPATYRAVVTKAWTALSAIALQPSGEVGYVQGATTGARQPSDGQPVKVTDTAAYGVGGFLLAGSEMVHILSPAHTTPPTVTGTAQKGMTLEISHGAWTNSPTRYSDAWQDCVPPAGRCVSISGATSSSYALRASDVGYTIRARVTAANASGSGAAWSPPTSVVEAGARRSSVTTGHP